ncbi:tetraacyldisaccharide 4'-kinase [Desulfonatronovibrio hydrogenovorans]|uniref:tetraacyldisaccharide 4'-kinase n=1 Tax=Desulfonatronovibrio hydrogenovorans TaxID=53245 RepID=UPI00068A84D4|nr:tetraacyldisaccharide 4'-kinase [Desulfonatronovibrio hydrogenovorans]
MKADFFSSRTAKILYPLGRIYALGVRMRQQAMTRKALRLSRPVISVGNISMGGTGKTPLCQFLGTWLADTGRKPVILTRGYKAGTNVFPHLVEPGDDPGVCGDEPLMLARSLAARARVVVDPDRVRAASWALSRLDPDVFILDDGFQHVRVQRDADLVLLTPHDLAEGWNRVVPAGRWREDELALARADLFMVNLWGCELSRVKDLVDKRPLLQGKPVCYFDLSIKELKRLDQDQPVHGLDNRPYLLVTGVANPGKVVLSISSFLGYGPRGHLPFADHHPFGAQSIKAITAMAGQAGVRDVICTSKDAVKLGPVAGLNIWEARAGVRMVEGAEELEKRMLLALAYLTDYQPGN